MDIQGIVICDQVIKDAQTAKATLVGVFDRIWAKEFPAQYSSLWVYAKLIDGPAGGKEIANWKLISPNGGTLDFPTTTIVFSPVGTANVSIQIEGLPFQVPGVHRLVLIMRGKEVAQAQLHVEQSKVEAAVVH